jgi:hypothetical protein
MRKFNKALISVFTVISLILLSAAPTNAEESVRYKSTKHQKIKSNKWTTLEFKGNNALKGNGARSLFCYQVGIDTKGKKKPKYVKVRLARLKSGKNDTTATNYFAVPSKPSSELVFSNCWEIETNSPVVVQIRITGGSKYYTSDIRQFKMWTPGADYPADFSDIMPDATL